MSQEYIYVATSHWKCGKNLRSYKPLEMWQEFMQSQAIGNVARIYAVTSHWKCGKNLCSHKPLEMWQEFMQSQVIGNVARIYAVTSHWKCGKDLHSHTGKKPGSEAKDTPHPRSNMEKPRIHNNNPYAGHLPITVFTSDLFSVARPKSPIFTRPVVPLMKMLSHFRSRWMMGGVRVWRKCNPRRICRPQLRITLFLMAFRRRM